jgi:hypothetical protein
LNNNNLTGLVPSLPFQNYTGAGGCYLQGNPSNAGSNHFTCPLPPVSPHMHYVSRVQSPPSTHTLPTLAYRV